MGSISARDLLASLGKARDMGLVEETFDVCGHNLVVRNLRPPEIEAVLEACKGLEDLGYVNAYQREHVARAVCELDGFDLRDTDFIDDEEHDPKKQGQMRRVRVERHKWLSDKLIQTWSQEVIFTVYRKIGDCSTRADKQAKDGVVFLSGDEVPEEKYRRILGDLREAEDEMPETLIDKTLEEFGLVRRSTMEELKAAEDRLARLRQDEEAKAKAEETAKAEAEEAAKPPPEPEISPVAKAMAARKPLNQLDEAPPPERPVLQPVTPPPQSVPVTSQTPGRAAQLAALEASADMVGAMEGHANLPPRPGEVAELGGRAPRIDPEQAAREAASIIDQPPPAGINPRFRPPPR